MKQILVGTVVQLKSGGPKMVVEEILNDVCSCVWFHKCSDAVVLKSKTDLPRYELNRIRAGIRCMVAL